MYSTINQKSMTVLRVMTHYCSRANMDNDVNKNAVGVDDED